jgi:hypothetical protein
METKAKVIIAIVVVVLLCCCLGILFGVLGGMGIFSGKKEEIVPEIKKDETKPEETELDETKPEEKPVSPAVVGVSGRYVKLVRPTVGCLNLAEIVIKSSADGANIAKSAIVTKSSGFEGDSYPVSNLIDDKLDNFVHSSCADAPWILIDLGKVIPIYSIVLTNRKDCCQGRTTGLVLSILDDAQQVVYTADPLVSQSGNTIPTEDVRDGSFMVYTWTLPNKTAVGSEPLPGYQPVVSQVTAPVVAPTTNWAGQPFSKDNRCGPSFNNTACTGTSCCSTFGWCGGSKGQNDDWCGKYHGFNGKYDALKP